MAIDYFVQNPDVAAAYRANPYGLTPEQFASTHYALYGEAEGRANPPKVDRTLITTLGVKPVDTSATDVQGELLASPGPIISGNGGILPDYSRAMGVPAVAVDPVTKLFQDTLGRSPTQDELERFNFGPNPTEGQLSDFLGFARNEAVNTLPSTGAASNIAGQILAQGTTDKWVGQGYGSPTRNAYDMGVMLAGQGITDIRDFGQRTNAEGGQEYFNKSTGEAIKPFYDRAGGNIWGGTFAGKDSTAYGVEFDAAGNPLFYSQSGGDSSDVPSWVIPALAIGGAIYGLPVLEGLLGGAGAVEASLTAAEAAGLGLTAAEASALGLSASEFAAAGGLGAGFTAAGLPSGTGAFLGEGVASGIPAFDTAFTSAGGLFNPAFGLPAGNGAFLGEGVPTGIPASDALYTAAGGTFNPAYLAGAGGVASTLLGGSSAIPAGVRTALTNAGVSGAVNSLLGGVLGGGASNLISGGLGTAGNLLQMQQSREAAQAAQARIDAETAAAKQAAAFSPFGYTSRFGKSEYKKDPVTGQLISASSTLDPDFKAQQDRFVALSNQGLTQAEGAQAQFAPLQTGAQRLFGLGNQYLAQSPEAVAKNYLNQQMALLQPGRELELATLQNRLQQQGRGGLSVSQGGTMGATTPELQALYNARATQEAQLAANAQQAGQQQVLYGAGLLGQGTTAMGNYYGGQQQAYSPYTTALGQVQNLEALGQQPLNISNALAQQASTAGARVGQLGLEGARLSAGLATSADATRNLAAQSLIAAGNPNAMFGQALGSAFGGLFGSTSEQLATNPYFQTYS
jgi:hypothetical protein